VWRPARPAAEAAVTGTAPRSPHEAAVLLAATVGAALAAMTDLRHPAPTVLVGRIEAGLREALAYPSPTHRDPQSATARGSAATRSACALLAAKAWSEAHRALLAARDHLGGSAPGAR
jgi:hypothetical protein